MKTIVSTMAGTVFKLVVSVGQDVHEGDDVIILESMKMEVPVSAEFSGKVAKVLIGEGDFVNEGDALVELE
ncbi:MAG: acetyl-CoA carboxylase biotin carboxyl carrier protein subunit [Acidibacillus sp.]|uniref:Biotin/lipoyl attachment protein n=1 Tax=Sulfoacidibacillus ferrooxidans TaxID=2005001 RepID=A0A9X1V6R3_9BACL|nr:acetyl-CoA carboxylase biotin carboxyl carrier protein subunit [Sulfoacidibacillus ferrooxidans]MCI0181790.1 Biotin/lipoyl attachment protein [Sulfoacidibacillus ferrooxidans]MCY0892911.1 acetyl-CoA carboxylase biotin carboxyl carrier protein subunit [Acidibacillus sp.]